MKVERVPWADGKSTQTKTYQLFLARWARRLSWKEAADAFRTSWDHVFTAVKAVVGYGLGRGDPRVFLRLDVNFNERYRILQLCANLPTESRNANENA